MILSELTNAVTALTREVGEYLKSMLGNLQEGHIQAKGQMDFVTEVDQESERRLVTGLGLILPGAGFIAEEGTSSFRGTRYNWIIDPLDGTTNFIHGASPFSISIALMDGNELVIGVIHDPVADECFSAWQGGPATLNGREIRTSSRADVGSALVATGFPYTDFTYIDEYLESLREMMEKTHGVRRLGSAAIDLAYVACGRYDAFYEYHLKPWDVAAGTVLIRQAGGRVCDFWGGDDFLFGETYVATNGAAHDGFLALVKKHFPEKREPGRP
ncbi:MAG: inositol monophosphatase family protein [Bacteroidales bacterium]